MQNRSRRSRKTFKQSLIETLAEGGGDGDIIVHAATDGDSECSSTPISDALALPAVLTDAHDCRHHFDDAAVDLGGLPQGERGGHAATCELAGRQGSTASSIAIWSSVRPESTECLQPVDRIMWMASGREGLRFVERIMLAYDWLMPVASRRSLIVGTFAIPRDHRL